MSPSGGERLSRHGDFVSASEPIRVLHVDDDSQLVELAATFLERETDRFSVTTETSVDAGLDTLSTEDIDCIVSDYDMPETSGLEFLDTVRDSHPNLPFILFTGKGSEEIASEAISAGVTEYFQKETGTDQYTVLTNRIEHAVGKRRAEQEVYRGFQAMESADEGIGILGRDGTYQYVNRAYAEIYDHDPNELLGSHWKTLYPDDEAIRFDEEILPLLEETGSWSGRSVGLTKHDERIPESLTLTQMVDGGHVCVVRELSSEPDREHVPPLDPQVLISAFDELEELFYVFDPDLRCVRWNDHLENVTGQSSDEIEFSTPSELFDGEAQPRVQRLFEDVAARRIPVTLETSLGTGNGTDSYELSAVPVESGGDLRAVVGVGRSCPSGSERTSRSLDEGPTPLPTDRATDEQLDLLASVLAHDLQGPISVARGRLELAREIGGDEQFDQVEHALERAEELIDDVTGLLRGRRLAGDETPIEFRDVVEDLEATLGLSRLSVSVDRSTVVRADYFALKRLLENLFSNAVEHGGPDTAVVVGTLSDGFYVSDDGPGIPDDADDDVFEPGYSTKESGTGFGLASVDQIVRAHDWEIDVTRSELGGARFEVTGVSCECPD
ncbi:response regulator [Natrarchaeobius halalkaliphilus]|uniref:histidine kinase n=1 Tax=Natrarchaeobius halalkaliphilus TaxID=1679091 RepID=A0A3N6LIY5_9EURY|nr:PAS domain-containing protein [Natrarchaeobius halalkaliphilus]RQG87966.1 response regulator [Natrarchaeobius halalkaliphilus]